MPNHPRISTHAKEQAAAKGFSLDAVYLAHTSPHICYANGRYEGQARRIRDGIVVVVDEARNLCVTVYANVVETELRPDQIARGDRIAS